MKYMGSKNKLSKSILPMILKDRKPDQTYVELFVGGANILDKVANPRIGNDVNKYVIALLNKMESGFIDFPEVSFEEYNLVNKNKSNYEDWYVGYVGFNSYGAKFFGGFRRDSIGKRNYWKEHISNLLKQAPKIKGTIFLNQSYKDVVIPPNSIIYCDPPYEGTTKYSGTGFNYPEFWEYMRKLSYDGHTVFISEYNAPSDFTCVFEEEVNSSLTKETGSKKATERLFTFNHFLSN
jgi:DNA adenine methylase